MKKSFNRYKFLEIKEKQRFMQTFCGKPQAYKEEKSVVVGSR